MWGQALQIDDVSTGGIFPCLFFLWVPSLFALYHTEFYSSEAGLQQALNATAILFGDKTALTKISGRCVSDDEHECSLVPGLFCSPSLNSSPSLALGWELEQLFKDAPIAELPLQLLASGELTVEELVVKAGAVPSMCKLGQYQR